MKQILHLQMSPERCRAAKAWFLSGADPQRWLEELCRCGLANRSTKLFVVPSGIEGTAPAGLLAIREEDDDSHRQRPAGLACGRVGRRLLVPVEAELCPKISENEADQLCQGDWVFLHPAIGASRFTDSEALFIEDLLVPAKDQEEAWNRAIPGRPPLPSLDEIILLSPPTRETLYGDAQQEIGTEPTHNLPADPESPESEADPAVSEKLTEWLASGIKEVARKIPHTAASRTWVNEVEDWADQKLNDASQRLEQNRFREIHRLMQMLEKDPDTGLRHAIPMNRFPHRGRAKAEAQLQERSVEFNPDALGSGPADFWNVPAHIQERLRRSYRDLANRELQLNRYRRAAYIFAQLLGDVDSAANALKDGKHFREAAVLYEESLNQPEEAARCLELGGLYSEALAIWKKLESLPDMARLLEAMGADAEAKSLWRQLVDIRVQSMDYLSAAEILVDRLRDPDAALEVLGMAWPNSAQAIQSLGQRFWLWGQLGRHREALQAMSSLASTPPTSTQALAYITLIKDQSLRYPDPAVRHKASDLTRVIAAGILKSSKLSLKELQGIIAVLGTLSPTDPLLYRDANRYLEQRRHAEIAESRAKAIHKIHRRGAGSSHKGHLQETNILSLNSELEILDAKGDGDGFYCVAARKTRTSTKREGLQVIRGKWKGGVETLEIAAWADRIRQGMIFERTEVHGFEWVLFGLADGPIRPISFPASDLFPDAAIHIGTPSWLPNLPYPVAFTDTGVWTIRIVAGEALLSSYDLSGKLLWSLNVAEALIHGATRTNQAHICLKAFPGGVAAALGNRLIVVKHSNQDVLTLELPGEAQSIVVPAPWMRASVVVTLHQGAIAYFIGSRECFELDSEWLHPKATFLGNGQLVLIGHQEGKRMSLTSRGVKEIASFDVPPIDIAALTPGSTPRSFALFTKTGSAVLYEPDDSESSVDI